MDSYRPLPPLSSPFFSLGVVFFLICSSILCVSSLGRLKMLEQLIQPITGPYSHSGFGDFISIKLVTLGYTSAFKSSRESTRAPSLAPRPRAGCHLYLDTQHVERIVSFPPLRRATARARRLTHRIGRSKGDPLTMVPEPTVRARRRDRVRRLRSV